jgi:predicted transcriptional regulator
MARRCRIDIIVDILRAAKEGSKRTKIVYETNLNFNIFREYLELLVERGLIEQFNDKSYTSDRGLQYIRYYNELDEIMNKNGFKGHPHTSNRLGKTLKDYMPSPS